MRSPLFGLFWGSGQKRVAFHEFRKFPDLLRNPVIVVVLSMQRRQTGQGGSGFLGGLFEEVL